MNRAVHRRLRKLERALAPRVKYYVSCLPPREDGRPRTFEEEEEGYAELAAMTMEKWKAKYITSQKRDDATES